MSNKFCNKHHLFFKTNYDLMCDPSVEMKFYRTLYSIGEKQFALIDKVLLERITKNWDSIKDYLSLVHKIAKTINATGNIKGFQIEDVIKDFNVIYKKIRGPKTFLKYMKAFVYRNNIYGEMKELLLILSNKERCEILLNKNLGRERCSKRFIEKIVKLANGDFNIIVRLLFPKVVTLKNTLGKPEYESIYRMFRCLQLIEKHGLDPLKTLGIKIKLPRVDLKKVLDELELNYIIESRNDFDDKPVEINSVSEYILLMKQRGHNLWYTINFIWDNLYGAECKLPCCDQHSTVLGINNIELQKTNYNIALKLFILCREGYISSINIFQNFE